MTNATLFLARLLVGLMSVLAFARECVAAVPSLEREGLPAVEALEGGLSAENARQLRSLLVEADRGDDAAVKFAARARWLPLLKQERSHARLDALLAAQLTPERETAEAGRYWATAAGLALWQHHLLRGAPVQPVLFADVMARKSHDGPLGLAQWYGSFLCAQAWPPLRPDHEETPRLMVYLNGWFHAYTPLQSMLGIRPGSAEALITGMLANNPQREPVQIGGEGVIQLSSKAPPVSYVLTFDAQEGQEAARLLERVEMLRRDLKAERAKQTNALVARARAEDMKPALDALRARQALAEMDVRSSLSRSHDLRDAWQEESDRNWRVPQWDPTRKAWYRGLPSKELESIERDQASNDISVRANVEQARRERTEADALEKALSGHESPETAGARVTAAERALAEAQAQWERASRRDRRLASTWDQGRGTQRAQAVYAYHVRALDDRLSKIDKLAPGPRLVREKQWHAWWMTMILTDLEPLPEALIPPARYAIPQVVAESIRAALWVTFGEADQAKSFAWSNNTLVDFYKLLEADLFEQMAREGVRYYWNELTPGERETWLRSLDETLRPAIRKMVAP